MIINHLLRHCMLQLGGGIVMLDQVLKQDSICLRERYTPLHTYMEVLQNNLLLDCQIV